MNHWRAWLGLVFLALAIGLVALVRWVEAPELSEAPAVADTTAALPVALPVVETAAPAAQSSKPAPTPDSFLLTDEEVAALSPAEQEQYLRMLESLQDIQQQVEVLEQEQSQLEQRVNQRSEQNSALHNALDAMRQAIEEPESELADPNMSDGVPGQAH